MRSDYVKYHLRPNEEVQNTQHLKGDDYVKEVLSNMTYEDLYGTKIYHSVRIREDDRTIQLDWDGRTNPDDE